MRSKEKTESRQVLVYICEVCNREYLIKGAAERCELQHRQADCKHRENIYSVDQDIENTIIRQCKDCGGNKNSWGLYDLNRDSPSNLLQKIAELIDESWRTTHES